MKNNKVFLFIFFVNCLSLFSQNFTWMKGDNFNGVFPGVYGTQGVASTTNYPGHRHGCATWVDNAGNLWLFGGEGVSATASLSWLNDLWKFNPSTSEWTWVKGSNAADQPGTYGSLGVAANANAPGAREFMMFWTDASGNFWLFGGEGFDATGGFGGLCDMWRYNPSTNQWTWIKGSDLADQNGIYGSIGVSNSANVPGGRGSSACWKDGSGNLWVYGGEGLGATGASTGRLSDLWRYNPSTNQWAWMHGPTSAAQTATYGTLGVPSVSNNPGAREQPACWADASGNLFLFGGRGLALGPGNAYLNDLWRYNISTDTWTWINGVNTNNPIGQHGTLGVASNTNSPGGRFASGMWTDTDGNFWLFGGLGWSGTGSLGNINDLWKYNPINNQWTWMKGSNATNAAGIYGTLGVANASNFPGARHFNNTWRNLNTKLWLFGGEGIDNNNNNPVENMNDLWGYVPPCNPDSINTSFFNLCSGGNATLTANNQYPANVVWYNSPSSTNSIGVGNTYNTGSLTAVNSSSVYSFYAQANNCTLTPRAMVNITVNPLPSVSIAGSNTVCSGSSLTLTANGANSYTWANGVMTNSVVVSPTSVTSYSVVGSSLGCTNSAVSTITVLALPTIVITGTNEVCIGSSVTLSGAGANTFTWSNNLNSNTIAITPTMTSNYTLSGTGNNGCIGSSVQSITVHALPTLTASVTRTIICKYETNSLTVVGANTYTWSNQSNAATIVITPTLLATYIYSVTGTNQFGCQNTATLSFKVSACENQVSEHNIFQLQLYLFPNPNNGSFAFKNESGLENLHLEIFNGLGQLVFVTAFDKNEMEIKSNLPKGIYFYNIKHNLDALKTGKLVIE